MSSSKIFSFFFYLLTFALLLQAVIGFDPLASSCSADNFTATSSYEITLNGLMSNLSYSTPLTGFGIGSSGQNPNQTNALALCRGDVNTTTCSTCVAEAITEIRKRCPYGKTANIWYDFCQLKYTDEYFFGQINNSTKFYLPDVENASDPVAFSQKTKVLLIQLANETSVSPKMYAAGDLELGGSEKVYGMVQCTRDLSTAECKVCLDDLIDDLPSFFDGKRGGRVITQSCNLRYEAFPFVNA